MKCIGRELEVQKMQKSGLLPIFGFLSRQRIMVPCRDSGGIVEQVWSRPGIFGPRQSLLALCRDMVFLMLRHSFPF